MRYAPPAVALVLAALGPFLHPAEASSAALFSRGRSASGERTGGGWVHSARSGVGSAERYLDDEEDEEFDDEEEDGWDEDGYDYYEEDEDEDEYYDEDEDIEFDGYWYDDPDLYEPVKEGGYIDEHTGDYVYEHTMTAEGDVHIVRHLADGTVEPRKLTIEEEEEELRKVQEEEAKIKALVEELEKAEEGVEKEIVEMEKAEKILVEAEEKRNELQERKGDLQAVVDELMGEHEVLKGQCHKAINDVKKLKIQVSQNEKTCALEHTTLAKLSLELEAKQEEKKNMGKDEEDSEGGRRDLKKKLDDLKEQEAEAEKEISELEKTKEKLLIAEAKLEAQERAMVQKRIKALKANIEESELNIAVCSTNIETATAALAEAEEWMTEICADSTAKGEELYRTEAKVLNLIEKITAIGVELEEGVRRLRSGGGEL